MNVTVWGETTSHSVTSCCRWRDIFSYTRRTGIHVLAALPALFKFPAWESEGSLWEWVRGSKCSNNNIIYNVYLMPALKLISCLLLNVNHYKEYEDLARELCVKSNTIPLVTRFVAFVIVLEIYFQFVSNNISNGTYFLSRKLFQWKLSHCDCVIIQSNRNTL